MVEKILAEVDIGDLCRDACRWASIVTYHPKIVEQMPVGRSEIGDSQRI
jgi:hypothetical protein